jgi:uncharacterized membrane protein
MPFFAILAVDCSYGIAAKLILEGKIKRVMAHPKGFR